MADTKHALRIKYGLRNAVTDAQAIRWGELTRQNIRAGQSGEAAGANAARTIFPDYKTAVYASEADTIEMLLREIGK
ncbi:hypothetical protein G6L67_07660 [Agrobacterium tumefaciens]|uniref:hypothetical protein n=1 Tax=Agrobacterium tumefaciens TaxID=358 RepID=UPI000EF58FF0|nr:hypothetical protein [Agrobacterium tumefaciens]AYM81036.1 hypothetical protein At12D1_11490 [Agrobacterium tumefaciens]NTE91726.1 hypothetical protein [Agrobacterium tumefaciens]